MLLNFWNRFKRRRVIFPAFLTFMVLWLVFGVFDLGKSFNSTGSFSGDVSQTWSLLTSGFSSSKVDPLQSFKVPHNYGFENKLTVITTIAGGTGDIQKVRELVGSLHRFRQHNLDLHNIIIYGFGLTKREINEITLWRNVDLIDGFHAVFVGQRSVSTNDTGDAADGYPDAQTARDSPLVLLNLIEANLRKFGWVLFVRCDSIFTADSLHDIFTKVNSTGAFIAATPSQLAIIKQDYGSSTTDSTSITASYMQAQAIGFKLASSPAYSLVSFQIQCYRGYHCDNAFRRELTAHRKELFADTRILSPVDKVSIMALEKVADNFCYLLLRDDILYSFEFGSKSHDGGIRNISQLSSVRTKDPRSHEGRRQVIALGTPTLSVDSLESYEEVAPIRLFMPSFLKTITDEEWKLFEYRLYIGYDSGDKFFDDASQRKLINDRLTAQVRDNCAKVRKRVVDANEDYCKVSIEYIEFPYTKGWVTYIWNGLFVHSIKDGADYFYQLNDDVEIITRGWSYSFVTELENMDNIGIVGPTDISHDGGLLTQAFVSWKHYEIFGRLYQMDIKDWFSDNWLTDVYEKQRITMANFKIRNVNDKGTRYTICMQPKYQQYLESGKQVLQDWIEDQKSATLSASSPTHYHKKLRLRRELFRGPIL